MDFLHPMLFGFDLRKRFELVGIGAFASVCIAQPAVDVNTGPLCG